MSIGQEGRYSTCIRGYRVRNEEHLKNVHNATTITNRKQEEVSRGHNRLFANYFVNKVV